MGQRLEIELHETNGHASPAALGLHDVAHQVFKHKGKAVLAFSVIVGIVVLGTLLSTKIYHSEAKLFVRAGRQNVTLDPTATLSQERITATALHESEISLGCRIVAQSQAAGNGRGFAGIGAGSSSLCLCRPSIHPGDLGRCGRLW